MILAVQMMLDWLGRKKGDEALREAATAIEQAGPDDSQEGTVLTYDLGGAAKCSAVGDRDCVRGGSTAEEIMTSSTPGPPSGVARCRRGYHLGLSMDRPQRSRH